MFKSDVGNFNECVGSGQISDEWSLYSSGSRNTLKLRFPQPSDARVGSWLVFGCFAG